ncbi:Multidrug resistance-associated protein [Blattamonas nauphoetae]|uniref:Multidrug resistance-associated protein n=1 Tax=Blattamonas nauphoetae TaxID=2049346 RepID=A0ABQ9XZG5_9EUKA|nr:Multidrug resistance-associated protein [Blattamonas nauphoetae]
MEDVKSVDVDDTNQKPHGSPFSSSINADSVVNVNQAFTLEPVEQSAAPIEFVRPKNSETSNFILCNMFYVFFFRFVCRCSPLKDEDIWDVSQSDSSQKNYERVHACWEKRYSRYLDERIEYERQKAANPSAKVKAPSKPGFGYIIFIILGNWRLIIGLILLLGHTMTHLLQPAMEDQLVNALADKKDDPTVRFPWLAGIIMMLSPFIHSSPDIWGKHVLFHFSTKVRAALTTLVFEKTLKLNLASQAGAESGSLLSLLATDSRNIAEQLPDCFHLLWIPVQFFAPFVIIIQRWGWTSIVAFLVLIVMLPMQITLTVALGHALNKFLHWNDQRNQVTEEIITGIRVIKFTGMEEVFHRRIDRIRSNQLKAIFQFSLMTQFLGAFMRILPLMVNGVTMTVYIFWKNVPQYDFKRKVIANLGYLTQMTEPFDEVAELIQSTSLIYIGQRRIRNFMLVRDHQGIQKAAPKNPENAIEITNATLRWSASVVTDMELEDAPPAKAVTEKTPLLSKADKDGSNLPNTSFELTNVNVSMKKGSLTMVVGHVGSGKSSFGSAILGDMDCVEGEVRMEGRPAYCSQAAWIINDTIRGNITFGLPFDEERYRRVVKACALEHDFADLAAGDETAIGERGVNLSGGQKARIQLARAVYSQREVYILDDPLSAVDTHVGKHLMEQCIKGLLKGKTIVLMTNQTHHKKEADQIVVIDKGTATVTQSHDLTDKDNMDYNPPAEPAPAPSPTPIPAQVGTTAALTSKKLIVEEEYMTKGVPWRLYVDYFRALLPLGLLLLLLCLLVFSILLSTFCEYWMGVIGSPSQFELIPFYLKIGGYLLVPIVIFIFLFFRALLSSYAIYRSGKRIHDGMLQRVLHAPISFFDTTPMGRIVNRFTGDMTQIDQMLLTVLMQVLDYWLSLIGNIVVVAVDDVLFLTFAIPILLFFVILLVFYARASRNLLRLESISRSRVLSLYGETCTGTGTTTIRSFEQQDNWTRKFYQMNDDWSIRFMLYQEGKLWSSFYACWIATLYMTGVIAFGWNTMEPEKLGVAINTAMSFSHYGQSLVRQNVDLESRMTSFERVQFYANKIPQETKQDTVAVAPTWPPRGDITFEDVSFRYRSGLDKVLKNVSFKIRGGEKIGICGRTGAGKTSLLYVLFRLVELDPALMSDEMDVTTGLPRHVSQDDLNEGRIVIDDVDISKVELSRLRRSIGIIPQDPTLFTGSIRSNIDLEGTASDEDIWRVLQIVEMEETVRSMGKGLDSDVVDGGRNLSAGQRQLLCFGRAVLNRCRIVVLDEATANVDGETDQKIQKTIREQFKEMTVLVIAHRLNTIMDSDRILVIGAGKVLEFDSPVNLTSNPNSELNKLINKMGQAEE